MFSRSLQRICGLQKLSASKLSVGQRMKMSTAMKFEHLSITVPKPFVYHVELNRPQKMNSLNAKLWSEIGECFNAIDIDPDCRVVILSGAGKLFCAGIDLMSMMELAPQLAEADDLARKMKILAPKIRMYQDSLSSLERCSKPVLAAVHSACIGAGVDMITAADMRYCTKDAYFQVKEVDIGMAADVGTLQRLPKIIGSESLVREICFTGRKVDSVEATSCGLITRVYEDKNSLLAAVVDIAEQIAAKSPVAVQGTKKSLVYARDHSVQEGLDQIALWNQFMLQSEDFATAAMGAATKQTDITFSKL